MNLSHLSKKPVAKEDEIGIRVMNLKTKKETNITGDFNTFEGGFPEEIMELVCQGEVFL